MKKKAISLLLASVLFLLSACGSTPNTAEESGTHDIPQITDEANDRPTETEDQTANTLTAYRADGSAVILEFFDDGVWKDENELLYYLGEDGVLRARGAEDLYTEVPSAVEPEIIRQDGDRYEGVIALEGMDRAVRYEHIVNKNAGFEMDYDYENFVRQSETDRERFISVWDNPENPEYYLEVTYSQQDAETVAAAISEELSKDYEITRGSMELDRAGSCIRIGASEVKGGGYTADQLQMVYIIPTDDGCRIATAHYGTDSADLFGARFRAMVNTLSVIDR